ncbi:MAG: histidinol dehydrogenase [Thaumarchaeota archaeon]|nr:histidinol dehydrogenase [Nitrososphaerota archaeon]
MRAPLAVRSVRDVGRFAAGVWGGPPARPVERAVSSIVGGVRRGGDEALLRYEARFGAARPAALRVTPSQVRAARSRVTRSELAAVRAAASRLRKAEASTMSLLRARTLQIGGATVRREFAALRSVGCYVPGGAARYPSSAIMSIVPARVAGVPRIAVASPPGPDGEIDALTLVAADMCGATEIYRMGGAQAIAALAHGTPTIRPVDKIVGPGGPYVTAAKLAVSPTVAIDMAAGPTELGIVADSGADADHAALDLVSQAEHSPEARCFLATDSARLARRVAQRAAEAASATPRSGIVCKSLSRNAFVAVCPSLASALSLADLLAPEHVQVMTRSPARDAARIRSAGMVLLGDTPSAASDYALGSNHILPTSRGARSRGPLSALDFVRLRVTARAPRSALRSAMPHIAALSAAEGLPAHANAVRGRLR